MADSGRMVFLGFGKYARADKIYVCKKLRISVPEFDALMTTTPKSHFDYASDARLIKTLQRTLEAAKRFRERLVA